MVILNISADTPSIRRQSTQNSAGRPSVAFEDGLGQTIDWYLENTRWVQDILNGTYMEYYRKQYGARLNGLKR